MNVLLATSRGCGINPLLPKGTLDNQVVIRGGLFKKLTSEVSGAVKNLVHCGLPTHVYVLAGINDITEKLTSTNPSYWYTEVIFVNNKDSVVQDLKESIDDCAHTIKRCGARPVFCTITNMNLDKYNNHLLSRPITKQPSTSILHHSDFYAQMQEQLNLAIQEINHYIVKVNRDNKVSTPNCHTAIRKKMGRGKGYHITDWSLLYDGLHATDATKKEWARIILAAIKCNKRRRAQSDDEMHSPEPCWKRLRRT